MLVKSLNLDPRWSQNLFAWVPVKLREILSVPRCTQFTREILKLPVKNEVYSGAKRELARPKLLQSTSAQSDQSQSPGDAIARKKQEHGYT